MSIALRGLIFLACAAALAAPQQPVSEAQRSGLESNWDIAAVFQAIGAHAGKMLPALEQVDARGWMTKGAPDTYRIQLESGKDQARALAEGAKARARDPEQLSAGLEIYFRVEGLERIVVSLAEAARKYQTPAAAQTLLALAAENDMNRDRLQRYLVNLAAEREQDLKVMDREAQRCRGMMTQTPPKTGKKK